VFANQASDIVVEIIQLLKVMEQMISPANIEVIILVFKALKSLTNNSVSNQKIVLANHLIFPINHLLLQWLHNGEILIERLQFSPTMHV